MENQTHRDLLRYNFFIFSSHKTSTQTIKNSLNKFGVTACHGHILRHLNLKENELGNFIIDYNQYNKTTPTFITVFREPISRLVSSFFQTYGTDMIQFGHIKDETESILKTSSQKELQEIFIDELLTRKLKGYPESLHILSNELDIVLSPENFTHHQNYLIMEHKHFKLIILKFENLIKNFQEILSSSLGSPCEIITSNKSSEKWYSNVYKDFKQQLSIPTHCCRQIYEDRKDIIDLLYPQQYQSMLSSALFKYDPKQKSS